MNVQLSEKELLYLYGNLKKELNKLNTVKPISSVKTDIQLHESIIKSLETCMPQLKILPL